MTHRRIIDDDQKVWDVWEVNVSGSTRRIVVPADMQAGWLAFQCGDERRRLIPLPPAWTEMSDTALLHLKSQASPIRPRVIRS
jgi:hypothetical protein